MEVRVLIESDAAKETANDGGGEEPRRFSHSFQLQTANKPRSSTVHALGLGDDCFVVYRARALMQSRKLPVVGSVVRLRGKGGNGWVVVQVVECDDNDVHGSVEECLWVKTGAMRVLGIEGTDGLVCIDFPSALSLFI